MINPAKHSVASLVLTLTLLGCAGKTQTMHYYQLAPTPDAQESSAAKFPDLTIGVGPVSVPEMLKRQELVLRAADNRYRLEELHRWAGLLEKNLAAVIIENLGQQLGTDKVVSFPWGAFYSPDYRVLIEILELTGTRGESATLRAGWAIVDQTGDRLLHRKITALHAPLKDVQVSSFVQAENEMLAKLCREISSTLREVELARN